MAQYYKTKATVTGFWEKYTFINNTPFAVTLISGKDFYTPLTTLYPHTKRTGNNENKGKPKVIDIQMSYVDNTGNHFYFSPDI